MIDLYRQEVIERQLTRLDGDIILRPSLRNSILTYCLLAAVGFLVLWAVLSSYARTEPARGILVPSSGAAKVYAMRPGVVNSLLVQEGQHVSKGQKLAAVALEAPNSDGNFGSVGSLASLQSQRQIAKQQIQFAEQKIDADRVRSYNLLAGIEAQSSSLLRQIELQKETIRSMVAGFDQLQAVVEKGFVSKLEYQRRYQALLQSKQDLVRMEQQLQSSESDANRVRNEQAKDGIQNRSELASAHSVLESLKQQDLKVRAEGGYLIEAPVSGRVSAIQVAAGQTISSSIPLMIVTPENSDLQVDIFIPTRAIAFIKPGQKVRLLYDAFPYQKFGTYPAKIMSVADASIAGPETNAPFKIDEPVYRVKAKLDNQSLKAYGQNVKLHPGMTLIANIVLERQTFFDWMLNPIRVVANRS